MRSLRTGAGHRDGLVKEMDPDVVNRDREWLADDDMVSGIICPINLHSLYIPT